MLVAKQASLKKIASYAGIIAVMLFGTAYMVYTNFFFSPAPEEGLIPPEMSAEDLAAVGLTPGETPAEETVDLSPAAGSASSTPETPAKKAKLPALEVIEDKKFIKLKEIIPEQSASKPGNPEPFKPYE